MIHRSPKKPMIRVQNKMYEVYGEFDIYSVKDITKIKKELDCDIAVKNNRNNSYLVCKVIEDATILEDVENQ
jgi:hypothetical protein